MTAAAPDASAFISKSRLEMLFDGVFAIAMTILVIEIKVPDLADPRSARELIVALLHHAPSFLSYALSFAMLGLFWRDAHRQFHYVERITPGLLAVNLFMMATAAFLPFCAALLGRYVANPATVVIYLADILLFRIGVFAQWHLAERARAIDAHIDATLAARLRTRNARAVIILAMLCGLYLAIGIARQGGT